MATNTITYPNFQAFNNDGNYLVGGKIHTYVAGTSARALTFSDRSYSSRNTNPIVLNARGEATIYGVGPYKFVLTDADDALIWTFDYISSSTAPDLILPIYRTLNYNGIVIAPDSYGIANIPNACNIGECSFLQIAEVGGVMTGNYNVEMFEDADCTTILYRAMAIPATGIPAEEYPGYPSSPYYQDWMTFPLVDADEESKFHLKLTNLDINNQATFNFLMKFIQWA